MEDEINVRFLEQVEAKIEAACDSGETFDLTTMLSEMTWEIVGGRYFVAPIGFDAKSRFCLFKTHRQGTDREKGKSITSKSLAGFWDLFLNSFSWDSIPLC